MSDTTRARWGRTKFWQGRVSALAVAVSGGILLAAAFGSVAWAIGSDGPYRLAGGALFALCAVLPFIALVWVLVVDRSTLRGAIEKPDHSIEGAWFRKASEGAFLDTLFVAGIATAVIAVANLAFPALYALMAVLVFMMASCAVRYLVARARG